jgi:hypothetical protein
MNEFEDGRAVRIYNVEPVIGRAALTLPQAGYSQLERNLGVPRIKHLLWCVTRAATYLRDILLPRI